MGQRPHILFEQFLESASRLKENQPAQLLRNGDQKKRISSYVQFLRYG